MVSGMIESADEFYKLRNSDSPDEYNRAAREEATEEVWIDVLEKFHDMKIWVIHNKTVPISILRRLSEDSDEKIRFAIASKRKLDFELFDKLSTDTSELVRGTLAGNPKCPDMILGRLAQDEDEWIVSVAKERLGQSQ